MTFVAFLLAIVGTVIVVDVLNILARRKPAPDRLSVDVEAGEAAIAPQSTTTWTAILGGLFPQWFDPSRAKGREKVVVLIRRAGYYPYGSPAEFYAAAIHEFGKGIVKAALVAGLFYMWGGTTGKGYFRLLALLFAFLLLWMAWRRPYVNLRQAAKKRKEMMRPNMLTGLAQLESLLQAGVGVQEALRRTASIGGPFCNLLGLLVARMEVEDVGKALERMRQHVPDPTDVNMALFIQDLEDYFLRQRPMNKSIEALRQAVHEDIVNDTAARAAKVRRTAGLFGVLAIMGMLMSILWPVQ